jgi:hypothetical protein
VNPRTTREWTLLRSLAFAAALWGTLFAALLPGVVAASPTVGTPITLCSGEGILVIYARDGEPKPIKHAGDQSLACALALVSANSAVECPLLAATPAPIVLERAHNAPAQVRSLQFPVRAPPRPPSTAPPQS